MFKNLITKHKIKDGDILTILMELNKLLDKDSVELVIVYSFNIGDVIINDRYRTDKKVEVLDSLDIRSYCNTIDIKYDNYIGSTYGRFKSYSSSLYNNLINDDFYYYSLSNITVRVVDCELEEKFLIAKILLGTKYDNAFNNYRYLSDMLKKLDLDEVEKILEFLGKYSNLRYITNDTPYAILLCLLDMGEDSGYYDDDFKDEINSFEYILENGPMEPDEDDDDDYEDSDIRVIREFRESCKLPGLEISEDDDEEEEGEE